MRHLYIAWVSYQRRAATFAEILPIKLVHIPNAGGPKWRRPFEYVRQILSTLRAIRAERADVVWFQSPPNFLAHLLAVSHLLSGGRLQIVADLHNAALRPPWSRVPGTTIALNVCTLVLVHNEEQRAVALSLGVDPGRLCVLEDAPPDIHGRAKDVAQDAPPFILVPCSFHADEPIKEVVEAARLTPEFTFKITGRSDASAAKRLQALAPDNVVFTGYVSTEEFNELLLAARVVLGLTKLEGIQLSAANEGIGAGKATVLSDTAILRELFGQAALFSSNDAASLAKTVREAAERHEALEAASRALKEARAVRWREQARLAFARGNLPIALP